MKTAIIKRLAAVGAALRRDVVCAPAARLSNWGVKPLLRITLALLAITTTTSATRAADVSLRFDAVEAETVQIERTGSLTGPGTVPSRAVFVVVLITPDGSLATAEMEKARNAAQTLATMLATAGKAKYGANIPITHEVLVSTIAQARGHRERLGDEGFTLATRSEVMAGEQRVGVEGYGRKDFPPEAIIGEATVTVVIDARPKIAGDGSIRLNLTAKPGAARATPKTTSPADATALQAALERFKAESAFVATTTLGPLNQRAWVLTARDREKIVEGATPLKKAIPFTIFGKSARVKLTIKAALAFSGVSAADPSWDVAP